MWTLKRYRCETSGMEEDPNGGYLDLDEVEEMLEGLCPPIDPRWRPMRTAPRDGTVVEAVCQGIPRLAKWSPKEFGEKQGWGACHYDGIANCSFFESDLTKWRPAHPEWNEDPDDR